MLSFRRCAPCSGPRCCSSWSTTCASEIEGLRDGPFLGKFWENSARSEMTRMTEFTGENGTFTFGGLFSMYKKDKKQRIRRLEPWLKFLAKPALWVQIPKIWATEVEEFWGFAAPKVDSHRSGGWDFESLSWILAENWDMSWIVMEDSVPLDACDWPGLQFSLRTWSTATSRMPRSPWRRVPCCRSSLERCSCRAAVCLVMWTRCKNQEHMVNYRSCYSLTKFDFFPKHPFSSFESWCLGWCLYRKPLQPEMLPKSI